MAGNQKSVDGSQKSGATAVYISTEMGYDNEIIRDENENIVRILVSGTGGRAINLQTKKYEKSFNQPLSLNLAMMTSAEKELPIRVILKTGDKWIYLGLWEIKECLYTKLEGDEVKVWIFALEKAVPK